LELLCARGEREEVLAWTVVVRKETVLYRVDRHGFDHVIRFQGVERYVAYSHGEKDCAALGCGSINLYLHRLDSGEQVGVLPVDE
jgi:hypothetical protein